MSIMSIRKMSYVAAFVGASALSFAAGRKSVRVEEPMCRVEEPMCRDDVTARNMLAGRLPVSIASFYLPVSINGADGARAISIIRLREHQFDETGDGRESLDKFYTIDLGRGMIFWNSRQEQQEQGVEAKHHYVATKIGPASDPTAYRNALLDFRSRLKVTCPGDPDLTAVLGAMKTATEKL